MTLHAYMLIQGGRNNYGRLRSPCAKIDLLKKHQKRGEA